MKIMRPAQGHEHITWETGNAEQIAEAKRKFDEATEQGHRAFRVEHKLQPGEPIEAFDPALSEILLVAPQAGG